jgi:hypothetical protein
MKVLRKVLPGLGRSSMRKIGVPFVPPHTVFYGPVPPAVVGGVVYGCLGFGLASVMGKRI